MAHPARCLACAIAPDDRWLATAGDDGTVHIWSMRQRSLRAVLRGHTGAVHGCAVSPDGSWLVSAGDDGVRVWDVGTERQRFLLQAGGAGLGAKCCAVAPDGSWLAAGGDDAVVRLWRPNGQQIAEFDHAGTSVVSCAISGDGQCLATVTARRTIHIWKLDVGGCVATMRVAHSIRHCDWVRGTHRLCVVGDAGAYLLDLIGPPEQ